MTRRDTIDKLSRHSVWLDSLIVGFEWDQNTDTCRHIDEFGETVQLTTADFDLHPLWGGMRRCTLSDAGAVNHYGANPRGDGLTLDGSDGRVMVQCPKVYMKALEFAPNVYQWWFSPSEHPGFEVNPAWKQRGGTERDYLYGGAFEASLNLKTRDHSLNTMQLDSKYKEDASSNPCTQPFTGGSAATPTIFGVAFNNGSREFVVGEVLTNNSLDAKVIDWHKSAGDWGTNDAAGTLYCQVYDDPWGGGDWTTPTNIADSIPANIAITNGATSHKSLTEANCRTYTTTNIGARWGFMNIWTYNALRLLFYGEYASLDSQTVLGKGVVDLLSETGFAGAMCGADSTNTNVAVNGSGTGTGTNGETPICWRGIENLWGNVWKFTDGYEAVDAAYRIINRDGSGTFANPMAGGDYESSIAAPLTFTGAGIYVDGYQRNMEYEDLLKYIPIGNNTQGSDSTYLHDYMWLHRLGQVNILLVGGRWTTAVKAGVGSLYSNGVASSSGRDFSARLEYI